MPTANTTAAAPSTRSTRMLPVILVAVFMAQFDLYVVNVALPVLQHDLSASEPQLQMFVGGYAFTYAAGLIIGGKLGDHFGQRRMFMLGMICFGVASLLCGLSLSASGLVVARLLQGATAAAMVPQVLALITATVAPADRPRALSWFGVTIGVGAVAGQVLGGLLLQADVAGLGWRVIFLINVPIAVVTVALAARAIPTLERRVTARLDIVGAVGITASLGCVLLPLVVGRSQGWPVWSWVVLIAALPVMTGFALWERRLVRSGRAPILPPVLFAERAFNLGLGLSVILFSVFFSFVFTTSLVLQSGLGLDPLGAGLTFGPLGVAFAVASVGARPYVVKYGAKVIVTGALVVFFAMVAVIVLTSVRGGSLRPVELAIPMTAIGFGNGIAVPAVIGQVLARIQPSHAGAASGVLATAQQFSSALGIAVIGGVFFVVLGRGASAGDYTVALRAAAWVDLLLVVIGIALALRLAKTARATPAAPTVQAAASTQPA